jgi:hypothetical protein
VHLKVLVTDFGSNASESPQKVRCVRTRGEDQIELEVLHQDTHFLAAVVEPSASSACGGDLEVDGLVCVGELCHGCYAGASLVY